MRVSDTIRDNLRELRASRDRDAGRIGAAYLDLDRVTALCQNSIAASLHAESKIGTDALRGLGLDPDAKTYRVTSDGEVEWLNGDGWEAVD